ncbi:MAG TPA: Ig-like domain-containing protein [Kofleriaceae bacterium]|nr:Ig-like domain-containing protein [Kofleriaceae bacterium]
MRRILVAVVGLGAIAALASGAMPGCYSTPEPACGFVCGTGATCPDDYHCVASENRCHLDSAPDTLACPAYIDAGVTPDAPDGAIGPTVTGVTPVDGATGVAVNTAIEVAFSEDVIGVNAQSFTVTTLGGPVSGAVAYDDVGHVAVFYWDVQLAANTTFQVSLGPAITDHDGLPLQTFSWSFTTGPDTVPPDVISTTPKNGDTDVATGTTITVQFDELVQNVDTTSFTMQDGVGNPIAGTVTTPDGITWIFTPSATLTSTTQFTVSLSNAITDSSGNALVPVSFSFTTGS